MVDIPISYSNVQDTSCNHIDIKTKNILSKEYENCTNNEKGFKFEFETLTIFNNHNLTYESNPLNWNVWVGKKHQIVDYDVKVFYDNKELRIECKYTSVPVYHKSFLRDWYQRDCDLIVTNDKSNLSDNDKRLLKARGTLLLDLTEIPSFIDETINNNHTSTNNGNSMSSSFNYYNNNFL